MAVRIEDVKPTGDRILVKRLNGSTDMTDGGIVVPETAQELGDKAIVVELGSKAEGVEVGQEVIIGKYAGTEVVAEGCSYLILRAEDVLAAYV